MFVPLHNSGIQRCPAVDSTRRYGRSVDNGFKRAQLNWLIKRSRFSDSAM